MSATEQRGLRILAADEDEQALARTARLLHELGHEVTESAVDARTAAEYIARDDPDLAIVVVHRDDEHALDLIEEISSYASGPVIAVLQEEDAEFVARAAERGISAYAREQSPDAVQGAIEVAMRRHRELAALGDQISRLEGALDRRAAIERAKGILMERHGIDARSAFDRLRAHARATNRTVVDVARAVEDSHGLLAAPADGASGHSG
ncbi:MAG TPA: ANTAR domain-containing protein [Solirubrobacteraceae bacterium]|nr:ANTAR domain-containing protein [Solirubrobacteraceae bacterium]